MNIFRIFAADYKRLKTNVIAIVMIIGLSIVPCLYAWLNILSNWDPYGATSTSQIKVAVASEDEGFELEGQYFNVGDSVLEALAGNESVGWVFCDTSEDAIDGVYAGDYYAALVIEEGFTENMLSFLTENMQHPEITYYCNEKKNAIAPKITDKVRNAVQIQVNATMISTIIETLTEVAGTAAEADLVDPDTGESGENMVDLLISKFEEADEELAKYEEILDSLILLSDGASTTMEDFEALYPDFHSVLTSGQNALNGLQNATSFGIGSVAGISGGLSATFGSISSALGSISSAYTNINGNLQDFSLVLEQGGISLEGTRTAIVDVREIIAERLEFLYELKEDDSYDLIEKVLETDAEDIGAFMSAPVSIETVAIYPVENYGSAMAAFYTALALWVGGLFLVAIIHTKVHPEPSFAGAKPYEEFFGRYLMFFVLSQIQALITVLGDLLFLGIQCEHPFSFWLASAVCSFVFSFLMYSLTYAMGNLGEGAAVIIMVIQVAGAGCTFPVEVIPEVFQRIYKLLPFTYALGALKETIAGMYGNDFAFDIFMLLVYVPISAVIGLGLKKPFGKFNDMLERNKEQSGVML
jgi:putative membrane protein